MESDLDTAGTQHTVVPDVAFDPHAEQLAVAATADRQLETDGCPECDQRPTGGIEAFAMLFALYSPAETKGHARCRACQTVFNVDSGEVVSA